MCREARKKTNHSLRASGATALFNAGVPEKLIRDVSRNLSNALHLYERTSIEQHQTVSKVLDVPSKGTYPVKASSSPNVFGFLFSGLSNCTI